MTTNPTPERTETIALDLIDPDPDNRHTPADDAFTRSVAQHGVLQPILVTPTDHGRYRLIAGARRYRAALAAGHTAIPASIRTADDATAAVWQAVENLARLDLTPSQEARHVARIMSAGMKQKALAAALNRPLSWVRARLAMVALPATVQDAIDAGTYDVSDALTFGKYADQPAVIDTVLTDNYRTNSDLDWRLRRATIELEAEQQRQALLEHCSQAGWTVHQGNDPTSTHRGARRLSDLGVDDNDHAGEDCHLVVITRHHGSEPTMTAWCTTPRRHTSKGASAIKTANDPAAVTERDDEAAAAREIKRAAKAVKAHRDAFARDAINAKLRGRDLTDFVLPVLFDNAGQTELTAAGKLLGVEPHEPSYSGGAKDYATPLRQWAGQSTANLTRAMLAIAYVHATHDPSYAGDTWHQASKGAVAAWLDGLGYQPEQ
jgi:ParB/RepB/Spo0J family partition protein